ncbi:MAG TPA: M15 family metallopeptidase [Kineosporiaceae bacterium]|nr:M15 family metallopeptidase [Kineosporiaceae bacterium]
MACLTMLALPGSALGATPKPSPGLTPSSSTRSSTRSSPGQARPAKPGPVAGRRGIPGPVPNGAGSAEQQPSAAQQAARARAAALHDQLREQAGDAEVARVALAQASQAAATALETYREVVLAQQQAQLDAAQAQARLEQAGQAVEAQRQALGRWAWQAYVSGGVLQHSPAMVTLLNGDSTDDLAIAQAVVKSVGDGQAQVLDGLRQAEAAQQQALAAATAAQQAADADATRAVQAKEVADGAVGAHRAALERAEQVLARTRQASAEADREAQLLALADAWPPGPGAGQGVTGPVGDCPGGDVSGFPNGYVPLALLCPLWGAPGKYLRADAEYAFDRLSHAYAQVFGRPICVTDAYRSYEDQVRVYAERPGFAARPGTSNHGWGTAADLCGGIESFGTPTHAWMLANAPLFGWFHPSWAEPTGSLPEAWHWEFGG